MSIKQEIAAMHLTSQRVFDYFVELCAIPHGSSNTKQISDYIVRFAKEHELAYEQDDRNNVVLIKEATKGYEQAEPVILQGHLDMVCEKENDCTIDFEKDGLSLYIDGDYLTAHGTTLGGDDGIAVAYALALLDDPSIAHPRLEVVLTVDEEVGMLGAAEIDLSMLKGHKMLNIDSDVEGHFLTSCAGGMTVHTTIPVTREPKAGLCYELTVTGLMGGHSGGEIDKERGNANILMGRLLKALRDQIPYGLATLAGGLKDNAIPRECKAVVVIDKEHEDTFLETVHAVEHILQKEYETSDPDVRILAEKQADTGADVLAQSALTKVLFYLRNVPDGLQHMSRVMIGLAETSLNNGILLLTPDAFTMATSIRSSVSSRKEDLLDRLTMLVELLGGEVEVSGDYPAWEYRAESALRDAVTEVYSDLFGQKPVFESIHAGLECGILSGKIADLDCVSFGPENLDIHTPKERLSISSVERVYQFLLEFLKRCD